MLYQDFSKGSLRKILNNMITILLISLVEMAAARYIGATWMLSIFMTIGFFLTLNYIYLRYVVEKLYEEGPFKILVKSGDCIFFKDNSEWIVSNIDKKEILLINVFNVKKRIHWKELDNYKLKS